MKYIQSHLVEFVIAILMFGAAILYLNKEYLTVKGLTDYVNAEVLEDRNIYQQDNKADTKLISSKELSAIAMGYREYPIVIDGMVMNTGDENYEDFLGLIKEGYYNKNYEYDSNHKITRIRYTFAGIT